MFRVISFNANGIRSAARKGFFEWLPHQNADVICVQELKAQEHEARVLLATLPDYQSYFHCALKKGYSGVAIFTRYPAKEVITGLGFPHADEEGRYLAIDLGKFWVASLYMPSGTSGETRQTIKFQFLEKYSQYLSLLDQKTSNYIICGDWNIAHKEIDLKNWRGNQKNSGFLPEERAWMDKVFTEMGFVDAFRAINPTSEQYTWWSNRGQARQKNVGWRIDYQVVTPGLKTSIKSAFVYKDQWFSDHAPLIMDYDILL